MALKWVAMPRMLVQLRILLILSICLYPVMVWGEADPPLYALSVYGGQMTTNKFEDFLLGRDHKPEDSYLVAIALAKKIGGHRELLSYEVEGQLVRHFNFQNHWEFNFLGVLRWEPIWWDGFLDSSLAFGLGTSYATELPEIETKESGETSRWLIYWMLELTFALPDKPDVALFARLHHRSNAFGLIEEDGGSNTPAIGVKFKF